MAKEINLPACLDTNIVCAEVRLLLKKAVKAKETSIKKFGKNTIDPFGAIFEIFGFEMDHESWKESETARQAQKSLQNHIGTFHQNILGSAEDWQDLKIGSVVDLKSDKSKVIAEIKNKHSTISGVKLADLYYALDALIAPKNSIYKDYTAYYVTIIPKKNERSDVEFTPSDNKKGAKCPANELIRQIDGASFYDMVFQADGVMKALYEELPNIIGSCSLFVPEIKKISPDDVQQLMKYFHSAFPG